LFPVSFVVLTGLVINDFAMARAELDRIGPTGPREVVRSQPDLCMEALG
jgi:hypothetical protein